MTLKVRLKKSETKKRDIGSTELEHVDLVGFEKKPETAEGSIESSDKRSTEFTMKPGGLGSKERVFMCTPSYVSLFH